MNTSTPPRTGHVGLNVTDLARSVEFYREVLGLRLLHQGRDGDREWAFLGVDDQPTLTLWRQSDGRFVTDRPGLHHLSFQVDTLDEVHSIRDVLAARHVEFHHDGVLAHREGGDSGGIFFTDPDGIRLEVFTANGLAERGVASAGAAPACGFF
jgi:lactoylglutathione lyase